MPLIKGYFKNLSTFRMFIIFLLMTAGGLYLYGRYQNYENVIYDGQRYRSVYDSLLDAADAFSKRLNVQESLGVALALQFEILDDGADPKSIGEMLNRVLGGAHEFIEGVGIYIPESGDSPRVFSYVAKEPHIRNDGLLLGARDDGPPATTSASSLGNTRVLNWALVAAQPAGDGSRFSSVLSVGLAGPVRGEAVVKADLDWLEDLLRRLAAAGADTPLCVTPEKDILWVEDNRLTFNRDFSPERGTPQAAFAEKARKFAEKGGADANGDFIRADIMGTGWILLVANPNLRAHRPATLSVAAFLFIIAASALVFEAIISSLGSLSDSGGGPARNIRRSAIRREEREYEGWRGVFSRIYTFLFRYRITNPEQERIDSELRVGRQIQFSLVPGSFPAYSEWREFDLYSLLSPAKEVGGDYYDFFMLDSNRLVLAVGDVSGKGVPAALYMAVARTAFRTLARRSHTPAQLMTSLNDMLVRESNSGLYVTIACFFVDLPTGRCTYALAGHPAPLLYRSGGRGAGFIDEPRETFVGMRAGVEYPLGELLLNPGDAILLYSDGVSEARNPFGEELGYEGLRQRYMDLADSENCRLLIEGLEQSVKRYVGDREQEDDITLLAFRYWGPGGQRLLRRRGRASARVRSRGDGRAETSGAGGATSD